TDTWLPTTDLNAPIGRFKHSAVWTGREMIVWGGENGDGTGALPSGGRYNPETDSWRPTDTITAPKVGRIYHSAVWDGSEMVVWGGSELGTPTPTPAGNFIDQPAAITSPNTGFKYCAHLSGPTPTPTVTPTPCPSCTPTTYARNLSTRLF